MLRTLLPNFFDRMLQCAQSGQEGKQNARKQLAAACAAIAVADLSTIQAAVLCVLCIPRGCAAQTARDAFASHAACRARTFLLAEPAWTMTLS